MTSSTVVPQRYPCHRCGSPVAADDRYCGQCRLPLTGDTAEPDTDGVGRDTTTRYLCAGAHLDEAFADAAALEYLVDDVRAAPPSPGADALTVLCEVVAARARRRWRDCVLLGLFAVLAVVSPVTVLGWGLLALGISGTAWAWRRGGVGVRVALAVLPLLVVLVSTGVALLVRVPVGSRALAPGRVAELGGAWPLMISPPLSSVMTVLLLAVLVADRLWVRHLTTNRFTAAAFVADPARLAPGPEATLRTLGHASAARALRRVAAVEGRRAVQAGSADVIVHRGDNPFVGSGTAVDSAVIVLPLVPLTDGVAPSPIGVAELHDHVAEAIGRLREASSLAPGRRLRQLSEREQLLIRADQLVDRVGMQQILLSLDDAPAAVLPRSLARTLCDEPEEWARYYRSFRVEAWDRDLVSSCHFYAGTDQGMLYLEWSHRVVLPVREGYRVADRPPRSWLRAVARAYADHLVLPLSLPRRARSAFGLLRPPKERRGEVDPERYGCRHSLRELASGDDTRSYFQRSDVVRYNRIIDHALVRAVGEFLEERGFSVVEFMRAAEATITNNLVISGSQLVNSPITVANALQQPDTTSRGTR